MRLRLHDLYQHDIASKHKSVTKILEIELSTCRSFSEQLRGGAPPYDTHQNFQKSSLIVFVLLFLPQPPFFLLVPPQPELFVTVLVLVPHLVFFYAPSYGYHSGIFCYLSFFSAHCSDRCNRQGRVEDEEGGKLEILFALPNFVSLKSLRFSTKGPSP